MKEIVFGVIKKTSSNFRKKVGYEVTCLSPLNRVAMGCDMTIPMKR